MWFFGKRNKKLGDRLNEIVDEKLVEKQKKMDDIQNEWRRKAKISAQVVFDVVSKDFIKQSNEGFSYISYSFEEYAGILFDNDILTPNFVFDELKKICKRNKIHAYTIKEENGWDIAYYCFEW
ncbi:hypothetical protein A8C46_00145 [Ligilactobacillus salivarius]|nr:hypothetical protein A8C38_00495 [Ligilactobacillus salivarius]PAY43623.1 hypothetical protein A8C39_00675 [Ligilactobacillus salivarius]PAY49437.1 hypothetical protein A8C42_00820 [Ligilactobacillus salivarius]PAY54787.1 hypothetical protein A8C41_06615 [Ligilactobacillus salivarius]PAY58017.1 hypothetical protein A8C46_00145 [Ligilactobacillus salivarius]